MKKILTVLALVVCVFAASAQESKHEIGVVVGTLEGVSYRFNIDEHLTLQADLGWKTINSAKGTETWNSNCSIEGRNSSAKDAAYQEEKEADKKNKYGTLAWTLEINPNLLYKDAIKDWDWGGLSWFAGGGFSLGFGKYCKGIITYPKGYTDVDIYTDHYGVADHQERGKLSGKFGLNAIGGVELALSKIPLSFSVDFRPGYGLFFDHRSDDCEHYDDKANKMVSGKEHANLYYSFFDWTLGVSARYCF